MQFSSSHRSFLHFFLLQSYIWCQRDLLAPLGLLVVQRIAATANKLLLHKGKCVIVCILKEETRHG